MANQWAKISKGIKDRGLQLAKNSFKSAGKQIIKRSPVDTGKFKGSWVTAIGAPIESSESSGNELLPVANTLKIGDMIFFTNSLPYNFRLEYGWSNQAPMGMVRVTLANWQGIVDAEAKKLK